MEPSLGATPTTDMKGRRDGHASEESGGGCGACCAERYQDAHVMRAELLRVCKRLLCSHVKPNLCSAATKSSSMSESCSCYVMLPAA